MKKKLVVAILAVLVLTVGGLAAAAPWGYGAGRGPFQPPQLTEEQKQQAIQWGEKMLELKKMRLDWAVQEGRLTQEQADQLMKFARERFDWEVKNGFIRPVGGRGEWRGAQLTEEQKQRIFQIEKKMLEIQKMRLEWAVQDGRLTQEQADQLMKFARERYEWQVKNDIVYPGGIFGHKQFFRFHGGKAPDGGPGPWGNASAAPKE